MATLCSHSAQVHLQSTDHDNENRAALKLSGMQRILSWATVLTAEVVVWMAGDIRLEDELSRFGVTRQG